MRSQLRRDAIPYLSVQPPAVQQHKMTISFADCLPPDVVHPLPFSFTGQKAKYANSTQLMLAMPNAAGSRPLGICSRCSRALLACPRSARSAAAGGGIPSPCGRCLQKPPPGIGWWRSMTIARR